ncbi:HD-GYP domain-containing protein [Terriglobus sp.]|uniref:HD-GYP domain-containing protein n=1 Tax=Terriglobus sp. TaxID=1889013 RepID=UPI003B0006AE
MSLSQCTFNRSEQEAYAADESDRALSLPQILSALSFALDLTEGAIPGHAVRSTLLGIRIARAMGLSHAEQTALYYALQLKDIGCSSNAARMSQIFQGDDRAAKAMVKVSDWQGLFDAPSGETCSTRLETLSAGLKAVPANMRALWSTVRPGASATEKIRLILDLSRNTDANTRELVQLRCDRGAAILKKLDMSETACSSVRHLDEHWDGSGYPDGLRGQQIPILARIIAVAQSLDVFALALGMAESTAVLKRRSRTWFDPEVVTVAAMLDELGMLWHGCEPNTQPEFTMQQVVTEAPDLPSNLHAEQIDTICEVFADVVDAKSPFTFRHSLGVAEVTKALAEELQLGPGKSQLLARAALLHDLGKLGVSNTILDKPGKLTSEEMQVIWQHPAHGQTILARVAGFEKIAQLAGQHHEKLDGSGYPARLTADQLSVETRLLTIADCFAALIESRPYRADMSVDAALNILRKDVATKIDGEIFESLENVVQRWTSTMPSIFRSNHN